VNQESDPGTCQGSKGNMLFKHFWPVMSAQHMSMQKHTYMRISCRISLRCMVSEICAQACDAQWLAPQKRTGRQGEGRGHTPRGPQQAKKTLSYRDTNATQTTGGRGAQLVNTNNHTSAVTLCCTIKYTSYAPVPDTIIQTLGARRMVVCVQSMATGTSATSPGQ
jgi:hypothetical protein